MSRLGDFQVKGGNTLSNLYLDWPLDNIVQEVLEKGTPPQTKALFPEGA